MLVQISEDTFVNLAQIAMIEKSGDEASGYSYLFYGPNKDLVAQSDFGSRFNKLIHGGMMEMSRV